MTIIPALRGRRSGIEWKFEAGLGLHGKSKASLNYMMRPCLTKQKQQASKKRKKDREKIKKKKGLSM